MNIDNPTELIKFIKTNFPHDDYISKKDGEWTVTDEWLVGTFAGMGFVGKTTEEATQLLIEYLNKHIRHESIVGEIVTKSGWPNANTVEAYIQTRDVEKESEAVE